jgi:hypothetical protein
MPERRTLHHDGVSIENKATSINAVTTILVTHYPHRGWRAVLAPVGEQPEVWPCLLLALSVSYCGATTCPELGKDRKLPAHSQSDAIDPEVTTAKIPAEDAHAP